SRRSGVGWSTLSPGEPLHFDDDTVDLVAAVEVLEHTDEPRALLAELRRVARSHVLVSVPREPLWRALNVARGAYWNSLGDTPGHVGHYSRAGFEALAAEHGEVVATRAPLP